MPKSYGQHSAQTSRSELLARKVTALFQSVHSNRGALVGALTLAVVTILIVGGIGWALSDAMSAAATTPLASGPTLVSLGASEKTSQDSASSYSDKLLQPEEFSESIEESAVTPTITGASKTAPEASASLVGAVEAIHTEGYEVGYALIDIKTGISVSYNADSSFYSASSLKGPYVIGLVEYELGERYTSEQGRITNIIEWSDNDAYRSLRYTYGNSSFEQLANAAGIELTGAPAAAEAQSSLAYNMSAASITDNHYEFLTPNQMLALWKQCYEFLASDAPGAAWLGEVLQSPENSAIRSTAGVLGTTWSKAGWFPADSAEWGTTVDAGVVRTNTGDVVLCVMTNAPEDFGAVESVVGSLLTLRAALTN